MTISTDSLKWDDYQNLQVDNHWVLIFDGIPAHLQQSKEVKKYSDVRSKVLNAIDHHAKGILIVTPDFNTKGASKTVIFDKNSTPYAVPVMKISKKTADRLFDHQLSFSEIENKIKTEQKPFFRITDLTIKVRHPYYPKLP